MTHGEYKHAILTAIRDNLAIAQRARPTTAGRVEAAQDRWSSPKGQDRGALVRQFMEELRALRAQVFLARTSEDGRAYVREVILQRNVRSVALSASPVVLSLGVESLLAEMGVEIITLPAHSTPSARQEYTHRLMTADLGITGADFGLAESGTLVVRTGPSEGRLASLVPPVHVAILTADRLLPDVAALISCLHHPPSSSSVIFITGPSRTADIEQTLTVGVHGPKELHVLLLE